MHRQLALRRHRLQRALVAGAVVLGVAAGGIGSEGAAGATTTRVPLSTAIYAYMAGRSGVVTVSVYDAVRKHQWWWHIGVRGYTASIVKVDILAALLRRYGTLSSTQASLASAMIRYSDNDAASTLYRQIGGATGLARFDTAAGLTMTKPNAAWGLTTTSSWDQVTLLKRLAIRNRLLTDRQRRYELYLMAHVVSWQRWGVTGGVPAGVTVALKNGWLPLSAARGGGWQVNSIGYVHGDGRRYLIAVLTHSPSFDYGVSTIRHISAIVWPYMWVAG